MQKLKLLKHLFLVENRLNEQPVETVTFNEFYIQLKHRSDANKKSKF